jgi:cell division protease FtsH
MQVPTEDRFLMTRSELMNKIASLLGGRAAEDIVFEDISTGAHNDLSRATDIAKTMIKQYGMSKVLGQVYFAHDRQSQFLPPGMEPPVEYSQATAELIDKEIKDIIDQQYGRALEILRRNRKVLDQASEILLAREKIDGDELKAIMKKYGDMIPEEGDHSPAGGTEAST